MTHLQDDLDTRYPIHPAILSRDTLARLEDILLKAFLADDLDAGEYRALRAEVRDARAWANVPSHLVGATFDAIRRLRDDVAGLKASQMVPVEHVLLVLEEAHRHNR